MWKDALLRGEVDVVVARRAAVLLGTCTARAPPTPALAERFDDLMPLIECRIDPYHRKAARTHPDLAAGIGADIDRLMTRRRALVLGDLAPRDRSG